MTLLRRRTILAGALRGFLPTDVPASEADALIAFYHATHGDAWTNNTGWLTDPVVDNWNGVTVAAGHVTQINLNTNNLVGAAGVTLDPLAGSLDRLYFQTNSLTTLDVSALTALTILYVQVNSLTVLDIGPLTLLITLCCNSNSITALDLSSLANGFTRLRGQDNGMNQAAIDSMINDIWGERARWTDATPELHVGGTNATPTGVYQDGYPLPLTALEKVHDLINDDDTAGFRVWTAISWNGGSAP